MHGFTFRGLRARYRSWGRGQPVLFLHSGGSSGQQWERAAGPLADVCKLIAPDLLGFGETEAWSEPGGLTHDLQAAFVAAVIEHAAGAEAVDVVGHSYGGATAIRLALGFPDKVRSLVLIEPIASCLLEDAGDPMHAESVRIARVFLAAIREGRPALGWEAFIDSRNGPGAWRRLSADRQQHFLDQSHRTGEAFLSNLNNRTTLDECRGIAIPITLVSGAATTAPDRRVTEVLCDTLKAAEHIVVPDAGHMSPLTHAREVASIVAAHLRRHAPCGGGRPGPD